MTRVLVVLQFTGGKSPQDRVRGRIYQSRFEAADADVAYQGRHLVSPSWHDLSASQPLRVLRRNLAYKALARLIDRAAVWWNEARIVRASRRADAVHFIKTDSHRLIERVRRASKARLVFDLSDALWLPDGRRQYPRLDDTLRLVDAVTCDNRYGEAYARQHNPEVFHWRPPSQVERFDARREVGEAPARGGNLTVGWIGSSGTAYSLFLILDALERVARRRPEMHLRLLGVPHDHPVLRHLEHVSWSTLPRYGPDEMVRETLAMDVGIHPVFDTDFGRMHGILKALVYMAGGAAVVASPVGTVPELVRDGDNGLLARDADAWAAHLERLADDADLRARLAESGLRTAREEYGLDASFADLRAALDL